MVAKQDNKRSGSNVKQLLKDLEIDSVDLSRIDVIKTEKKLR